MDDCIIWEGHKNRSTGYGQAQLAAGEHPKGLRQTQAHRKVMADIHGWDAVHGKVVMHTCDNPPCVNPEHLRIGTQQENIRDCISKRRFRSGLTPGHSYSKGELNARAKLTWQDVSEIRSLRRNGAKIADLAEAFKVHRNTISMVTNSKTWST